MENEKREKFIVPIGPQHPALKEPGHFEFAVDGETVTGATVRLGYVHRGIEKATEDRNWTQNLYLLERICGICSHSHAMAYSLGVEKLAGVTVPPRAQAIRQVTAELERIHSHLLWLGVAAHEAGFDTLFMFSWRDRETVMDILEGLTGNRVNYSVNVLGGVKIDIDAERTDSIRKGLDFLEERTTHYLKIVTTDETFLRRTRGVGFTTTEQAEALGLVGPTARAANVARDVRVDVPYITYTDLTTRMPRRIKEGETVSRIEAPRGELFYFIKSGGGEKPERIKVRTPSINNFALVTGTAVGHQLADMPMILAGMDPCFSCNDR